MGKNLGSFSTPSVSETICVNNSRTHNFEVTASNVVGSVVVRIESSRDGSTWVNVTNNDLTITEDGVCNLIITDVIATSNLRFVYVSGTGDVNVRYENY